VLYGDSIIHGAAPFVTLELARYGITVINASVGITSPCDALRVVDSDMVKYNPELVAIGYVGNSFTSCINGAQGLDIYIRHYLDTQQLIQAIGDRPILLDTPPGDLGQGHYTAYDVLVELAARAFDAQVADTAAALLDPVTKRFEKTMPCTVLTVCTRIDVRGPDNYHLTAAGGYLYARVLTRAILKRLHIPSQETKSLF
jgi:hypothetical protein